MDPASMVHALEEVWRVLTPEGILLDVRPLGERWPIEVVSARNLKETGQVMDLPEQLEGDRAANGAIQKTEARGWFRLDREEFFPFFYSWDTPSEMEEFIAEDWADFVDLSEEAKKATRSTWALGEADSRVRVRVKVLLTKWRKVG
jgi:hypothetical protein